ncbi:MAG TPA: T9SS type A sorting domain-containing protein [Bacteroidia bacterium]
MKKQTLLFVTIALLALQGKSQLTLTGTGYTQNFDGIGSGLPPGWGCYYGATSTGLGTAYSFSGSASFGAYYDTTNCASSVFGTGFKNCASATAATSTMTCAAQQVISNRALGLRQSSNTSHPGYDPGPSFVLHLANTTNISSVNLSFNLQGLDIRSTRTTTWTVDYGFGATPTTFTSAIAVGTMTTGGGAFTNNPVTVNFGSALDNQNQDVWIRVAALVATSGSGSRTTSAIDDFSLTYSNTNAVNELFGLQKKNLEVLGTSESNKITFSYYAERSEQFDFVLYDMQGRIAYNKKIELQTGMQNFEITNANLPSGIYIARLNDSQSIGIAKVCIF